MDDILPPELPAFFGSRAAACAAGEYRPIAAAAEVLTWNVARAHSETSPTVDRWTDRRMVALVNGERHDVVTALRRRDGGPQAVTIIVNRREIARLTLTSGEWQPVAIPLVPNWIEWLRGMHRVEIKADGLARGADPHIDMRPIEAR